MDGLPVPVSYFRIAVTPEPLLTEAPRVLALKAAVFELTAGDEQSAELLVPQGGASSPCGTGWTPAISSAGWRSSTPATSEPASARTAAATTSTSTPTPW